MHFMLVRPNDDESIVELIAVQRPKTTLKTFHTQWDLALARVKKLNPETWSVTQVFQTLEQEQGWTIMKLDPLTVEY